MPGARILAERLRLGVGFGAEDRGHLLEVLSALDRHLTHWPPEQVAVQISVINRGGPEQEVTLEARLADWPPLKAASADVDLGHALVDARKDLIRQIEDERATRDPRKHRRWRWPPA